MLKIGVIHDDVLDPFLDGVSQSGYFLCKTLKKIGFNIEFISFYLNKNFFKETNKVINFDNIKNYDLFLDISRFQDLEIIKNIFKKNKKIILNLHNNVGLLHLQSIVDNDVNIRLSNFNFDNSYSKILIQESHKDFSEMLSVMSRVDVDMIPFIWDPDFILDKVNTFNSLELNKEDLNKVGIFESNKYFYKNSILPLGICEGAENIDEKLIKFIFISGMNEKIENTMFKIFYQDLLINKNKKTILYKRFNLVDLISKNAINTIVTNNLNNPLNYHYFETLYLNRPLIHNSRPLKSVGYYYDGFDAVSGSKQLVNAIKNFDIKKESEKINNLLPLFSSDNKANQEKIKNIILKEI
jgi:hypothetical protein